VAATCTHDVKVTYSIKEEIADENISRTSWQHPEQSVNLVVRWRIEGLLFKREMDVRGKSFYEFDEHGFINRHSIEFTETNPPLDEILPMLKTLFRQKTWLWPKPEAA
jgi:hypothetical protein